MRELTTEELRFVAGGEGDSGGTCSPGDSGNSYGGVSNPSGIGDDLVELYEGAVAATSHVIERVASAFD